MAVQTFHMINDDVGFKTLKTRAGDVFTLGAWIFPKVGNAGGGTIKLNLHCSNSTGAPAATDVTVFTETVPAAGSWSYITANATIPANYDTVDPQITLTTVPVGDTIYFDDLLVRETTAAQNAIDAIYQSLLAVGTSNNLASALKTQFTNWMNNLYGTGNPFASTVVAGTIPGLDGSKIISGLISQTYLSITSLAGSIINSVVSAVNIPGLDASKIITGLFGQAQIPSLTNAWGKTIDGSNLVGSILASLVSGTLAALNIPGLDASKIISGLFGQTQIPSLTSAWAGTINSNGIPVLQAAAGAPNMVLGPDFESTGLWTGAVGSQSTLQNHSGTHSWAVNGAG